MSEDLKNEMARESDSVEEKTESTVGSNKSETPQLQSNQTGETGSPEKKESQTLKFLDELSDPSNLFHTPEFEAVANINHPDHQETWRIDDPKFELLLAQEFFKVTGTYPKPKVIEDCKRKLIGTALFESKKQALYVRLASFGKAIYIDLGNSKCEQVEIDENGWRIIPAEKSPVRFERPPGMEELPKPVTGGSLKTLRGFFYNIGEKAFIMIIAWLVTALNPDIPTPILNIFGEQGSGKSTLTAMLRGLIDPSTVPHRALPRNERELAISASKVRVLCFDNLSGLSVRMSDAFCRLVTGAGFIVRGIFTNSVEKRFNNKSSIIVNGITNIITRNDFADRSTVINTLQIQDKARKQEKEIWKDWDRERAKILGALCDAASMALKNLDKVDLPSLPRMADFVQWIVAAEPALPWEKGAFLEAYYENCLYLVDMALDADPVGTAVLEFIESRDEWSGTATDLLKSLNKIASPELKKLKAWPKRPNVLSNSLMRVQTFLRKKGVEVERKHSGTRTITLRKIDVSQPSGKSSWGDNRPSVDVDRPNPPDAGQVGSHELPEVPPSEIDDYEGEPGTIEDLSPTRQQGEI